MAECERCGEHESLPYNCRYCGGQFCSTHRLPENHDCPGLEDFQPGRGVFDSGFDDSVSPMDRDRPIADRIGIDTDTGGPLAYFRGNATYVFLVLMWLTFLLQWVALVIGGRDLHNVLFVLSPQNPEFVWTWVTSIFAHSPVQPLHIVFNSIVIFFFGPLLERYIGSRDFAILFIVSGILAGLSQIGVQIAGGLGPQAPGVLGASGAALAILGVLTIFNPSLRVYLFGVVPMAIWILTVAIAAISLAVIILGDPGAGGIAHTAHLVGLLVGLAYGAYVLQTRDIRPPRQFRIGGGGNPGRRY